MSISSILLIVIILVILYYIIKYFWSSTSVLISTVSDATVLQTITASSLMQSTTSNSASNFSYSIWIYITDWSYNYGQEKIIFARSGDSSVSTVTSSSSVTSPCPLLMLGSSDNNLIVSQEVYNTTSSSSTNTSSTTTFTCGISNIPIQKWVNILVSVYGRSMDLYLDGKLVRTCVMPGTAKVSATTPVYLTPDGGFSGYISKFEYWNTATTPQTAWNIYSKGYTNNWSLFSNNYSVEVSLYNGNTKKNSITI